MRGFWDGTAFRFAPRRKLLQWTIWLFYQPSAFAERGGQIEFVAQVKGHELTTRGELLRDEADHARAKEEYFKIQIGTLENYPNPSSPTNGNDRPFCIPQVNICRMQKH